MTFILVIFFGNSISLKVRTVQDVGIDPNKNAQPDLIPTWGSKL